MVKRLIHPTEGLRRGRLFSGLLMALLLLTACNESVDDDTVPEPDVVTSLDITVTGANIQAPEGNVYLFYTEETNLDYAVGRESDRSLMSDGNKAPLIDVSRQYNPVVRYEKNGQQKTLHPVSAYGTLSDGRLDTYSSVRYSQIHFDITRLSSEYGKVKKGSLVLVVIVLNSEVSRTWVAHPLQLRRDYVIHVALPDYKTLTYVPNSDLGLKWWQVEGNE